MPDPITPVFSCEIGFDPRPISRKRVGMSELCDLIERHCRGTFWQAPIPRLVLGRVLEPTTPVPIIYHPLFCMIAKGRKQAFLEGEIYEYDANKYLVASVDLPIHAQVLEGPVLGLTLSLDISILAEMVREMPEAPPSPLSASRGLAVTPLEDDLLDPLIRMVRLLDRPQDIPIMAPLIEREIYYRLLTGPRGEMLRQRVLPASSHGQIGKAIELIRHRYTEALRIEDLAQSAGMSAPSFHRHFRAVTAMSPLQFQKQIRLREARRMLLSDNGNASTVAFEVGYESPSQFSREYRRLFGVPPAKDKAELKKVTILS